MYIHVIPHTFKQQLLKLDVPVHGNDVPVLAALAPGLPSRSGSAV